LQSATWQQQQPSNPPCATTSLAFSFDNSQFISAHARTLAKLDEIVNQIEQSYEGMSELQAEGATTGFSETLKA